MKFLFYIQNWKIQLWAMFLFYKPLKQKINILRLRFKFKYKERLFGLAQKDVN